jgi:hypothetical protein
MSELLITQNELDDYLTGLDLTDPVNNRVFNAIQLLTPALYNDVLYYLVIGKITVPQLNSISINNAAVKMLIDSIVKSDDSSLARKRIYQNFQDDIPAYKWFVKRMNETSPQFFYRTTQPNSAFITIVSLDKTGVDRKKFTGLFDAKTQYNKIVEISRRSAEYDALIGYAQIQGYDSFVSLMNAEINQFRLLTVEGTTLRSQVAYNDSVLGYVLRGVYTDPFRVNLMDNMDYALMRMVDKFDVDANKFGIVGIRASWENNTWDFAFAAPNSRDFIQRLGQVSYIRYVIPFLYGSTFFTQDEIDTAKAEHTKITSGDRTGNGLLDLAYKYLIKLTATLRVAMTPEVKL